MLVNDVLFNNVLDRKKVICSNTDIITKTSSMFSQDVALKNMANPALCGGNIKSFLNIGNLQNAISVSSVGTFNTANLIKENPPYYKEYDVDGTLKVIPTFHFLVELHRQLAGAIEDGTSTFSPEETQFYLDFQEWQMGAVKTGDLLTALEYLDDWLVDELVGNSHPKLNRNYDNTHKWNKIFKRGATI